MNPTKMNPTMKRKHLHQRGGLLPGCEEEGEEEAEEEAEDEALDGSFIVEEAEDEALDGSFIVEEDEGEEEDEDKNR